MADTLGLEKINPGEPDKRLWSLEASFNYTISRLPENTKKLLYGLTILKSAFSIDVAEKIFNGNVESIIDLYNRSLLLEIKSETSFGQIQNPDYWVYSIHPAIRNYLERTIQFVIKKTSNDLEKEYGVNFCKYYFYILLATQESIGKDNIHRNSIARFNLIFDQGENNNDFDRAIAFAKSNKDLYNCANMLRTISYILNCCGILSKALDYIKKTLEIDTELNNKVGLARDYDGIGLVFYYMNDPQALDYIKKTLEIDTELNNKLEIAKNIII